MRRFNSGLAVLILAGAGAGANAQIKERIQSFVDAGEIPGAKRARCRSPRRLNSICRSSRA